MSLSLRTAFQGATVSPEERNPVTTMQTKHTNMHLGAEARLNWLTAALEQVTDSIIITDADGCIQYVNAAFEAATGYSRQEAIGRNPRLLKSGKHDAAFYTSMWQVLLAGNVWRDLLTNKRKDGSLYEEEQAINPVRDAAGRVVNYVSVGHDVTGQRRLESQLRQAQKMESIGRLAGGLAHDFNNFLMGIMVYANLAQEMIGADHPVREYLEEITRSAQRSADLTRQLLAFARKQPSMPVALDLNETVSNILKLLRRLIGEDIDLVWKPEATVATVRMDRSQIDQILANLAVNARDAISGVGRVTIQTGNTTFDSSYCADHPGVVPGVYVRLTVTDTGCGMDKETLAHIFEPFFTTKRVGKGTGLGLATVFGIVQQNKGFIDVSSEPGEGSTFAIYLPTVASQPNEPPVATPSSTLGSLRILVVEDEDAVRNVMARMLTPQGHVVEVADNGSSGLAAFSSALQRQAPFDLVITDIVMPDLSGDKMAEQVKKISPSTPVLFMSGYAETALLDRFSVAQQGSGFLQKPFTADTLLRKIAELVRGPAPSRATQPSTSGTLPVTPAGGQQAQPPEPESIPASTAREPDILHVRRGQNLPALRVLVVDDEPQVLKYLELLLHAKDCVTMSVPSGERAVEVLPEFAADVALVDYPRPNGVFAGGASAPPPSAAAHPILAASHSHVRTSLQKHRRRSLERRRLHQ